MNMTSKDGFIAGELGWSKYPLAYPKAVNLMRKVQDMFDAVLQDVDLLIMPTTVTQSNRYPGPDATVIEQANATAGKVENTCVFNGTGHPALAMPIGFVPAQDDPDVKVPTSLQIVGKYWDEANILKAAYLWENARDWKKF